MARGPKRHLKRLNAPKCWLLDKLSGVFAPRPMQSRFKLRECLPLILFLRNRLKYALNKREVEQIVKQRLIKIDNKVRTNRRFPTGFMDVISIEKSNEHFRMLYDPKGRFVVHRISAEEAKFKLLRVNSLRMGRRAIPFIITHDGRTVRFPDPLVRASDTVKMDLTTGKMTDFIKFGVGNVCMVTGGHNVGRAGIIIKRERHPGSFDVVHLRDANNRTFATRLGNAFVIGKGETPWISLPKSKGIKLTITEERDKRLARKAKHLSRK